MTTQPRLVTLRTAPMLDPGEWCRHYQRRCHLLDKWDQCKAFHMIYDWIDGYPRRPQSCIDGQQPSQLPMLPSEDP